MKKIFFGHSGRFSNKARKGLARNVLLYLYFTDVGLHNLGFDWLGSGIVLAGQLVDSGLGTFGRGGRVGHVLEGARDIIFE